MDDITKSSARMSLDGLTLPQATQSVTTHQVVELMHQAKAELDSYSDSICIGQSDGFVLSVLSNVKQYIEKAIKAIGDPQVIIPMRQPAQINCVDLETAHIGKIKITPSQDLWNLDEVGSESPLGLCPFNLKPHTDTIMPEIGLTSVEHKIHMIREHVNLAESVLSDYLDVSSVPKNQLCECNGHLKQALSYLSAAVSQIRMADLVLKPKSEGPPMIGGPDDLWPSF